MTERICRECLHGTEHPSQVHAECAACRKDPLMAISARPRLAQISNVFNLRRIIRDHPMVAQRLNAEARVARMALLGLDDDEDLR